MVDGTTLANSADSQESGTHTPPSEPESSGSEKSSNIRTKLLVKETGGSSVEAPTRSLVLFSPRRWGLRLIPWSWFSPENVRDGRFEDLRYESVDEYPEGYPSWAAFQNSDPTFRVYRRYGTLRNRVILHKQEELADLELQLKELDAQDSRSGETKGRLGSLRRDREDKSERIGLMEKIELKLKEYDDLLERESKSGAMRKAPKRNFRTLVNYLWNERPISKREMRFLARRDDFIILTDESDSILENLMDWTVCRIPIRFFRRLFASENQRAKLADPAYVYTSSTRLAAMVRIVAIGLAILVIGVPIYFLNFGACSIEQKQLIVIISVVFFPIIVQLTARTKNHEMFALTAAYCAVLTACLATTNYASQAQGQGVVSTPMVTATSTLVGLKRWGGGWIL